MLVILQGTAGMNKMSNLVVRAREQLIRFFFQKLCNAINNLDQLYLGKALKSKKSFTVLDTVDKIFNSSH